MAPKIDHPIRLTVRCFAQREGDQWQAFSLEFGLAAQADTFPTARHKLDCMIRDYVYDALVGEDQEHAFVVLDRKATVSVYAKYHLARFMRSIKKASDKNARIFREPMPLAPQHC